MNPSNVYDGEHPVLNPLSLHLETPAITRLSETLQQWLWTGASGGAILGMSRAGKSIALQTLASRLTSRSGIRIPVVYIAMPMRDQHTILSVLRALCWSAELRVTNADRADHLAERFMHYLADRASAAQLHMAVLFVDEMQRLVPNQFNVFAELYDKLQWLGIRLTVIFVGNDQESSDLLTRVEEPAYAHIRGRFFTRATTFQGLTSETDVKACLSQYDVLRYPAEGPTYVEYFLPQAAQSGWRFASLSRDFWRTFRGYDKTYKFGSWGMQYFTVTANTLLTDFLAHYGIEAFSDEMLDECMRMSGLLPSKISIAV